jgi:hypothetical protein
MANLRGTVQGYSLDGRKVRGEGSRLGAGMLETTATTWHTCVAVDIHKNGTLTVSVVRDGKTLHHYNLDTPE